MSVDNVFRELYFNSTPGFGRKADVEICQNGLGVNRAYLKICLFELRRTHTFGKNMLHCEYKDDFIYHLIKMIEIEIDGTTMFQNNSFALRLADIASESDAAVKHFGKIHYENNGPVVYYPLNLSQIFQESVSYGSNSKLPLNYKGIRLCDALKTSFKMYVTFGEIKDLFDFELKKSDYGVIPLPTDFTFAPSDWKIEHASLFCNYDLDPMSNLSVPIPQSVYPIRQTVSHWITQKEEFEAAFTIIKCKLLPPTEFAHITKLNAITDIVFRVYFSNTDSINPKRESRSIWVSKYKFQLNGHDIANEDTVSLANLEYQLKGRVISSENEFIRPVTIGMEPDPDPYVRINIFDTVNPILDSSNNVFGYCPHIKNFDMEKDVLQLNLWLSYFRKIDPKEKYTVECCFKVNYELTYDLDGTCRFPCLIKPETYVSTPNIPFEDIAF